MKVKHDIGKKKKIFSLLTNSTKYDILSIVKEMKRNDTNDYPRSIPCIMFCYCD